MYVCMQICITALGIYLLSICLCIISNDLTKTITVMCRLRHTNLGWHIGGHPAPLRHEGFEGYRGHQ